MFTESKSLSSRFSKFANESKGGGFSMTPAAWKFREEEWSEEEEEEWEEGWEEEEWEEEEEWAEEEEW